MNDNLHQVFDAQALYLPPKNNGEDHVIVFKDNLDQAMQYTLDPSRHGNLIKRLKSDPRANISYSINHANEPIITDIHPLDS
jgi:hypothetical protein